MELKNPILMAQIGAPHGIKGEVRVKSFAEDPMALGDYGALYAADGRKFKIMKLRPQKTVLVVKFKGTNFRDEAEALNGTELFIDRSALPNDVEDDEFYVTDLIGCRVQDDGGNPMGDVLAVPDFGAGSMLEIAPVGLGGNSGANSWLVEFTNENVPDVDLENRLLTVRKPDEVSERDTKDG